MSRCFAPEIAAVGALGLMMALATAPLPARAQTNIDQGKSAAEIFNNDCAVCHKTPHGLAKGQNSLTLSTFLREHYTASRDQAASLAAYVMGAGGTSGTPAAVTAQKPGTEPKTAAHPSREAAKHDEEPLGAAKPQRPDEIAKPEDQSEPGQKPATRLQKPAIANRGQKPESDITPAAQEPPAAVSAPSVSEPAVAAPAGQATGGEAPAAPPQNAEPNTTTSSSEPAESQPGDNAPVPRDNIPD